MGVICVPEGFEPRNSPSRRLNEKGYMHATLSNRPRSVISNVCERSLVAALCRDDKIIELHLRVRSNTERGRQDLIDRALSSRTCVRDLSSLRPASLERIFDVDHIPHNDSYAVSRNWVPGSSLDQSIEDADPASVQGWLRQCLQALQYLHRQGLHHGRVSPQNIICEGDSCILIGISIFPNGKNKRISLLQNKNRDVLYSDECVEDLEATWASFLSAILSCSPQTAALEISSDRIRNVIGTDCAAKVEAFIADPSALDLSKEYLLAFGLKEIERLNVLSTLLTKEWNISSGHMTFLTLDMLNDPRPKSRNQIVLNALRSRRIAGNKANRSSMSSAVSRLKSAGIAEDHGKKIRLTADFSAAWAYIDREE